MKFSLNDIWRKNNWKKPGFTWCNAENTPVSRIDYICISDLILSKVEKINVTQVP
jgi:exonuclease III